MSDNALSDLGTKLNSGVPDEDIIRMTVYLVPTTHALVRLLTVVRGRGAQILDLQWQDSSPGGDGRANILIAFPQVRHPYLTAVIERIVDVKHVVVHGKAQA